jgi:hypothetical protein
MDNPRKAGMYFQIVTQSTNEDVSALSGLAESKLDQRDFQSFNKLYPKAVAINPDADSVKDLIRKRDIYYSPLVTADFEFANGKSSAQNLNSGTADLRVYSDPISDNYRVYARFRGLYSGPSTQSNLSAGAAGVKYTAEGHDIAVEGGSRNYAKVEGTKYLNDSWSGTLAFEKNGFYLFPGSLYPTYMGNVASGTINWKNNDNQKAFVGYQYWSLTNNNQQQAFAGYSQKLITLYNFKLDGSLYMGNQQNTNPNVGYFAPWNQTEYSGTAALEFLQWRDLATKRYAFWHKLWGTYGVVTQQGFATLPMNTVGYGQNFDFGDRQRMTWGVGKTYFPFDGVRSNYLTGYLRFEKSF